MECKLRCVNFRRVSDPRRAFRPAFRVTGISGDCYRSTIGVIVIGLGTPRSAGEDFGCTWEHLGAPAISLEAPGCAGVKSWCAGDRSGCANDKPRSAGDMSGSTSNQSLGKTTSSLGTLLVRLEIIATIYRSTIVKTHVFSLYSHLCIYIATDLHTV